MSKLLLSVRSVEEAKLVRQCEIGILDVKEPSRGGLGASDRETLQQIAELAKGSNGSQLLSFSAGELNDWNPLWKGAIVAEVSNSTFGNPLDHLATNIVQSYGSELLSQFGYVKIGLAGVLPSSGTGADHNKSVVADAGQETDTEFPDWQTAWQRLFDGLPSTTRSVAVVYADFRDCGAPPPKEVIQLAAEVPHCDVVLIDTCHKSGNLFSHVSITELKSWVDSARRKGLDTVVAGSVDLNCLGEAMAALPDFIGVRGAVCRGDRVGKVAPELVQQFAQKLETVSHDAVGGQK